MAWCCGCGVIVPEKDTPGWYVFRPVLYRGFYGDFYSADNKKYLCPDCAGSVRAWLGVD